MAFAIGSSKLSIEATGTTVTIPNDNKAKLMYYINCICSALDMDTSDSENIQRLRDYRNYNLSVDETAQLFVFCAILSPDILLNKVIFQSDELCGDRVNQFYKISKVQNRFVVTNSILIGGQTRRVNQIMAFKMSWLREYYLEPMSYFADQIQSLQHIGQQRNSSEDCCCTIL